MLYPFGSKYLTPTKDFRRLSILLSIYNSPHASQHKIGKENDLSSSMVNNYIKCFKEEGIINVTGSTNRNQRYYLTQAGYSELMRSFLSYSAEIVQIYGAVKREISKILRRYLKEGIQTIVLFGAAETAEVVYAAVKQTSLSVIGIVDSDPLKQGKRFEGLVIQAPEKLQDLKPDAVLITSFAKQEEIYAYIRCVMGEGLKIKKLKEIREAV